jgi:hypothetical protein
VYELGWQFGYGDGTNGTPAPYFDNVRVKVYPTAGARIAATEIRLANDGFPAIGDIDLGEPGRQLDPFRHGGQHRGSYAPA